MLTVGKRFERFLHISGPLAYSRRVEYGSVVMADPPGIDRGIKLDNH